MQTQQYKKASTPEPEMFCLQKAVTEEEAPGPGEAVLFLTHKIAEECRRLLSHRPQNIKNFFL